MIEKVLRACRRLVLVPALAGCATSGPAASGPPVSPPASPPVPPASAPETHATQPAPAEAPARWKLEVSLGRCGEPTSCPLEVRLVEGGKILDAVEVGQVDGSHPAVPEAVEPFWGAGDPLVGEPTRRAQRYGAAENEVSVLVREVALAHAEKALLVTQRGGFEHIHRKNDLFVVTGGRLVRGWQSEEGAGPRWSSVAIVPRPGGAEALVFFDGFLHPDPAEPDTLSVRALTWDLQKRAVVERPQASAAAPVYAALVGRFADAKAARKAAEASSKCLERFWVLPLDQIPGAGRGAVTLAALSTRRDLAEKAREDAKRCLSAPWAALIQLP